MSPTQYSDFQEAVDAAFALLDPRQQKLVFVVPAQDRSWRIIGSVRKAALRSREQLAWASMWEQVSGSEPEKRDSFLRMRLFELASEQHALARMALNDLELTQDESVRLNQIVAAARIPKSYVADHTGYGKGGENFEHDDTGSLMNYSGVHDDVFNAFGEHNDWEDGYDY